MGGQVLPRIGGSAGGAVIGGIIGSLVPGIGTAIGASLGGALGGAGSTAATGGTLGQTALAGGTGALAGYTGATGLEALTTPAAAEAAGTTAVEAAGATATQAGTTPAVPLDFSAQFGPQQIGTGGIGETAPLGAPANVLPPPPSAAPPGSEQFGRFTEPATETATTAKEPSGFEKAALPVIAGTSLLGTGAAVFQPRQAPPTGGISIPARGAFPGPTAQQAQALFANFINKRRGQQGQGPFG